MTGLRDPLDDMTQVGALAIEPAAMIRGALIKLDLAILGHGDKNENLVLAVRGLLGALAHEANAAARIWDRMHAEDLLEHQLSTENLARVCPKERPGGSPASEEPK